MSKRKVIIVSATAVAAVSFVAAAAYRQLHPRYTSTQVILVEEVNPKLRAATCSSDQARKAEAEADRLGSWRSLYDSFVSYANCDDGAIAEGYSDSISHLLADQWAEFDKLDELAGQHPPFKDFVLRHVDELMSPEQAKTIEKNARSQCPPAGRVLCGRFCSGSISISKADLETALHVLKFIDQVLLL